MLSLGFPALALSIGCALLFSASDYFRKAVPAACSPVIILFYFIAGQIPILALWLVIGGGFRLTTDYIVPGIAVAILGLGANLLFIVAIRRSPLSLMIPLLGLVPVLTLMFGGLLLGEWPTWRQSLGIGLVTFGLFILYQPTTTISPPAMWRNLTSQRGLLPMLAVVVTWSITPSLDKLCVEHASVGVHGLIQVVLITGALAPWIAMREQGFRVPRDAVKPLAGSALAAGVAYAFQLAAYQITLVAIVEVLKRTIGLVGALVLGKTMFNEPATAPKILGMIIMAAGLPLVILA